MYYLFDQVHYQKIIDSLSEREGHVKVSLQQKLNYHSKPERQKLLYGYSEYSVSSQKTSTKPPWRNGLARWTSNSKVVGSSPIGGVSLVLRQKVLPA